MRRALLMWPPCGHYCKRVFIGVRKCLLCTQQNRWQYKRQLLSALECFISAKLKTINSKPKVKYLKLSIIEFSTINLCRLMNCRFICAGDFFVFRRRHADFELLVCVFVFDVTLVIILYNLFYHCLYFFVVGI